MDELQAQSEREARILARRKRIQERLAALREGDHGGGKEGEKKEEIGKGKQQIIESKRRLMRVKYRTDQDVTSVRAAGDDRENQHRIAEEQTRQDLRAKLLAEAEQSARQNAAVAMRWADLFSIEVPQDLYTEIEAQRQACERIISSKDALISEVRGELKKKDDEFVKTLKRQAEDIDTLLQYMSRQFVEMQNAFKEELDEIENAFLQERSDLLESNRREMQELFDRRSRLEQDFMDRYLAAVESYQQQLEGHRQMDAEEYHILKIKLETDIQNLEQHLEAMRATYQLNTEKLEYNYRVLKEREKENSSTIESQKKKLSRQRDILSSLKQRYAETDRRYRDENMRLTDEYKRITEQFKDLQSKFRHFELVDTKKYKEVWGMKESEVAALVRQLLQADKVLHEQQLGWEWRPPDDAVFTPVHSSGPGGSGGAGGGGEGGDEEQDEDAAARAREQEVAERLRDGRNWGALGLLCDEAGFLLDAKAKHMIERLPKDEQGLVKAEGILRALGISDGASFDSLMDALSADSTVEMRAKGMGVPAARITDGEKGERGPAVLVHPDDAVRRLKAFVEVYGTGPSRPGGGGGAISGPLRVQGLLRRAAEREQEFWARMTHVISDKGVRVWRALEKQLEKYLGLLQERSGSLRDVESLQHQNNELRALLNQYLSSRINEELQIPPTQVI
ncbi:DNA replication checkpoint protein Drc1 [Pleodorina starrii]|nr:DNA replication checkpoint protein Drc1 [Pleodorina starrii]